MITLYVYFIYIHSYQATFFPICHTVRANIVRVYYFRFVSFAKISDIRYFLWMYNNITSVFVGDSVEMEKVECILFSPKPNILGSRFQTNTL